MFWFGDDGIGGYGYDWIEVMCCQCVFQIVDVICLLCGDQCEIVLDWFFNDEVVVVDLDDLFVICDWCVKFGCCQNIVKIYFV